MEGVMGEDHQALEQFTLLAKSLKGRAVVGIIQQTLSSKRVFVFGELLAMPNVQALRETEHAPYLLLLELFAYGRYSQYRSTEGLPELNPQQTLKLRQLSIVSIAREREVVPYALLHDELDVADVRNLEDVIIETIYAGLVSGKMDQKSKLFRVARAAARDVAVEDVPAMAAKLKQWAETADKLVAALDQNRQLGTQMRQEKKDRAAALESTVQELKKNLKDSADHTVAPDRLGAASYDGMDLERPKRRGKRSRMPFGRGRD
ncbi:hypothetical protein CTAYLR_006681 [Chrysophaeum taylorii]|uniref:PCI domain-containing protein n=1 Tax=Chrysophaeum taylorii TaxID=2483200 RepID=A0AAD7UDE2_9STRA|nr:hypothetical protein CTAYLR_006681 [Chrysophaeum taylorii]